MHNFSRYKLPTPKTSLLSVKKCYLKKGISTIEVCGELIALLNHEKSFLRFYEQKMLSKYTK